MKNADQLRELGETLVGAMSQGDLPALLAHLHPEVELNEPESLPYGGTWTGHDGFGRALGAVASAVELVITGHSVHPIVSGVIIEMDVEITGRGTGRTLRTRVVEIDRVDDEGRVRTMDLFYKDTAAVTALLR